MSPNNRTPGCHGTILEHSPMIVSLDYIKSFKICALKENRKLAVEVLKEEGKECDGAVPWCEEKNAD